MKPKVTFWDSAGKIEGIEDFPEEEKESPVVIKK